MQLTTWAILAMFIIGLMYTMTHSSRCVHEAFEGRNYSNSSSSNSSSSNSSSNDNQDRCPNILIQKGSELYLHNSRLAKVPGVNPLKFANLEEYTEFMEWQRSQGIRCPVMYLQHSFDAQGNPVYKIRPSPLDPKGGLPPVACPGSIINDDAVNALANAPSHRIEDADNPPMDAATYPAFDPMVPKALSLQVDHAIGPSANPMHTNWAGDSYTKSLIARGKYAGNEVSIRVA